MPALQSNSSDPSSPAPDALDSQSGFAHSIWRPLLSCAGALFIGVALAPWFLKPATNPGAPEASTGAPGSESGLALVSSEVGVTQPVRSAPFKLVTGHLNFRAGIPVGTSTRGAVARQVVPVGQKVKKGDPVVEISVGAAVHTAPAVERKQTAAEKAQVAAADEQNALAQKVGDARFRLAAAQTRIDAAQLRIKETREIIKRLRQGEHISLDAAVATSPLGPPVADTLSGAPMPTPHPPRVHRVKKRRHAPPAGSELQAAARAQQQYQTGLRDLEAARARLKAAEYNALQANAALKAAADHVDKVESQFADQLVAGSAVEEARSAAKDAQGNATDATNKAFAARQDVKIQEQKNAGLQAAASAAGMHATQLLKGSHLFEGDEATVDASPVPNPAPSTARPAMPGSQPANDLTLGQAITMARAALKESQDATAQADAIKTEIDTYQHQVTQSKQHIDDTSKKLEQAQQQVMDAVPKPKFVPILAPFDGTVTWLAPLAQDVAPGQKVFGLSSTGNLGVDFEVQADQAKILPPGSTLTATLKNAADNAGARVEKTALGAEQLGAVANVKVERSAPAHGTVVHFVGSLEILVPGNPTVIPEDQMPVLISIPDADAGQCVVPTSAVVENGGKSWLATLTPGTRQPSRRFNIAWIEVHKRFSQPNQGLSVTGVPVGTRYVRVANTVRARLTPGTSGDSPLIVSVGDGG